MSVILIHSHGNKNLCKRRKGVGNLKCFSRLENVDTLVEHTCTNNCLTGGVEGMRVEAMYYNEFP